MTNPLAEICPKHNEMFPCFGCAQERLQRQEMRDLLNTHEPVPISSSNPKDIIGDTKVPLHLFPASAIAYGSLGMLEGKLKYGYVNFRATKVVASIYVAAAMRHLLSYWEGENSAPDTNNPHLGNALATIAIVVDAYVHDSLIDDRPLIPDGTAFAQEMEELRDQVKHLKELFADKKPKHYYQSEAPNKE